jgi:hypothetical protein
MVLSYLSPEDDGINGVGPLLSPDEVIRRLRQEFKYVHVNKERGTKYVEDRIRYLRGLQAKGKNPFGVPMEPEIERLNAIRVTTVHVMISDDDPAGNAYLSTYLLPGSSIMFTYASPEHYEKAQPLLNRVASVLKYEIEEGG